LSVDAWLDGLPARHAGSMRRPEFLKAIRALSARYVEHHGALTDRSPLDSAGKRAAFAGFYAPLHFLTTRAVIAELGGAPPGVETIVDAGCGTGVAGAAWAVACAAPPVITGIDLNGWALDEARATWRALGLRGRTSRADFVTELERLSVGSGRPLTAARTGIILGWSLNEIDKAARLRAQRALDALAGRGARILAIEPVSRKLVPWWDDWSARGVATGARAGEWRFPIALPPVLAALDRDAGFDRDGLTARSLAFNWNAL
jgi:hypothetical protein